MASNPVLHEVRSKLLDEGVGHSHAPGGWGLSTPPLPQGPSCGACLAVRVRGRRVYKLVPWLDLSLSFLNTGQRSSETGLSSLIPLLETTVSLGPQT